MRWTTHWPTLRHEIMWASPFGHWVHRRQNAIGLWMWRRGRKMMAKAKKSCPVCGRNLGMGIICKYGHLCFECYDFWYDHTGDKAAFEALCRDGSEQ